MTDAREVATAFRRMADRIELNAAEFSGAFLIAEPAGDTFELLLIDPAETKDSAVFWGMIQTRVQIVLANLQEQGRNGGFGRR